jgi:hypothetical protein
MSKREQKTTSLERALIADRKLALDTFRMFMTEVVAPLVPALVRSLDADTGRKDARTRRIDEETRRLGVTGTDEME